MGGGGEKGIPNRETGLRITETCKYLVDLGIIGGMVWLKYGV